jgi:CDP-glucose 4,6-dehydratase
MESMVSHQQLSAYYNGKKVFVTGHTGFKGAWLVALLNILGATVKGYALAPEYDNSLFNNLAPLNICESIIADIRNKSRLSEEILSFQPDYIFHLAAQPLVRRSYQIPAETFDVNVVGTANILEAANGLEKDCSIVIITTDKVYENKEQDVLYKEDDRLGGYDPYSASKACTEIVVSSFRNSFFKNTHHSKGLASARAGNVIGGGEWSTDRIIPDIIKSLQHNNIIEVRNPRAIRPWQHVLEPLGGYLLLGGLLCKQPHKYDTAFNFGPHPKDHLTVKQLVELAITNWRGGEWKDASVPGQPHEAGVLKLDITKANQELQWQPKLDAATAIEWTIDWYKQPISRQLDYTFEQIKQYLQL